jgi:hypothetical protein
MTFFFKLLRVEQIFDGAFEPVEGGYRFHAWTWGKGYLVTEDEFQRVRREYLSITTWRFMWQMLAWIFLSAMVVMIAKSALGMEGTALDWIGYVFVAAILALMMWRGLAPQRLVWGRKPFAPRRSQHEQDSRASKTVSWLFLVLMLIATLPWLIVGGSLATAGSWWGIPILAIAILAMVRIGRWAYFKVSAGQ